MQQVNYALNSGKKLFLPTKKSGFRGLKYEIEEVVVDITQ